MSAQSDFDDAIGEAKHLTKRQGFDALKRSEGAAKVSCSSPRKLLGSVDMDGDCKRAYPTANRWDYLVGIDSGDADTHYIEVHSVTTHEVSTMERKLRWLKDYIQDQSKLARMPARYYWVASGKFNIPKHTAAYRRLTTTLRKKGLEGPMKTLRLPC